MRTYLTWTDNSSNEEGFVLERSTNSGSFSQFATKSADETTHYDEGILPETTYAYRIFAYSGSYYSKYSNIASVYYTASICPDLPFGAIHYTSSLTFDDIATYQNTYGMLIPVNITSPTPIGIWVRSSDFQAQLTLIDPTGSVMETQNGNGLALAGDTDNSAIGRPLPVSGSYLIEVSSADNAVGEFQLYISPGAIEEVIWSDYTPEQCAYLSASNYVAVISNGGTELVFYDATNNVIAQQYSYSNTWGLIFSPTQSKAYVWAYDGANYVLDTYDVYGTFLGSSNVPTLNWSGKMVYDNDKDRIVFFRNDSSVNKTVSIYDIGTTSVVHSVNVAATGSGQNLFWGVYSPVNEAYYFSQHFFGSTPGPMVKVDANTYAVSATTTNTLWVIDYITELDLIVGRAGTGNGVQFFNPLTDNTDYVVPLQYSNFTIEQSTFDPCNSAVIVGINQGQDSSGLLVINSSYTASNFIPTRTDLLHPDSSSLYIYSQCLNTFDHYTYVNHGDFSSNLLTSVAVSIPISTSGFIPSGSVPDAPSNLMVSASTSVLSWQDNSSNESRFVIEQSTDGMVYSEVLTASFNTTQSTDQSVSSGSTYWWRVAAANRFGTSSYSNTASVAVSELAWPPSAPSNVVAIQDSASINVTWTDNSNNETTFSLHRQHGGGGGVGSSTDFLLGPNSQSFVDTTAPAPGTDAVAYYQYSILAANNYGSSSVAFSGVMTFYGTPSAPSSLTAISGSVNLNWTNNTLIGAGIIVEKSTDGVNYNPYYTASAAATSYSDTNVTESNTYWYRLFTFSPGGTVSAYSNTASIELTGSGPAPTSSFDDHFILDASNPPTEPYGVDITSPTTYTGSFGAGYAFLSAINCPNLTGVNVENNFSLQSASFSGSTALTVLRMNNNLTGTPPISVLDVSTNTALTYLDFGLTHIATIDLSNNTALTYLNTANTDLTSIDLTNNTALIEIEVHDVDNLASMTLPSTSTLSRAYCWGNISLTTIDISTCPELDEIDFSDCALPEAQIDQLLADIVAAGHSPSVNNYIDISNYGSGTNAPPSAAGLASIATLQGNGWNVYY